MRQIEGGSDHADRVAPPTLEAPAQITEDIVLYLIRTAANAVEGEGR